MEAILNFILNNYPTIGLILAAIIITWFVSRRYSHWTERIKSTEKDCKKIDEEIMPELKKINTSISSLLVYLKAKDNKMDTALFVSNSPLKLTELGNKLLIQIGGQKFVDDHVDELVQLMDDRGITTALDSQTIAPLVIAEFSSTDSFKHIKDYIYSNPIYKGKNTLDNTDINVKLDLHTVYNIMGIYLRDKYLERHPNLNPEDIPDVKNT